MDNHVGLNMRQTSCCQLGVQGDKRVLTLVIPLNASCPSAVVSQSMSMSGLCHQWITLQKDTSGDSSGLHRSFALACIRRTNHRNDRSRGQIKE